MKWPYKLKHRNRVLAKVYRPCSGRPGYRLTWYAAGKRMMKSFRTFSGKGGAREYGEALVKKLAAQSAAILLTPAQATDALAAIERLASFHQATGRKASLLGAVSEWCAAATKLRGRTLTEATDGFLRNAADVQRRDLAAAVEEFVTAEEPRTIASHGQRAQLSGKYHYNRAIQLRRFAEAFAGYAVADLGKQDLDVFFASKLLAQFSAKSRNHHRAALRQFLAWAVRRDYLASGHRLLEADAMRPERANTAEVGIYTAKQFRTLLETAKGPMQAMIAIGGLAGLRTQEMLRLDWSDVWRVPGHIEVTARKAKTRARRLVEICPALAAWLEPFRAHTSGPVWAGAEITFQQHFAALCEAAKIQRKANGLRHSFVSFNYATHGNENLTAQQAGTSPAMIHQHYRGLVTKIEAQAWFAVKSAKTASNIVYLKGATA